MSTRKQRRALGARIGASPGALTISPGALPTTLRLARFDARCCEERADLRLDELKKLLHETGVTWVDVVGYGSQDVLLGLRDAFEIPHLVMADVVNVPQRPKFEAHREGLFALLQIPRPTGEVDLDQLSFFVRGQLVISFREHEDGIFDALLTRLQDPSSRLRSGAADYLVYRLIDAAMDAYFPHLDRLSERLDAIEALAVEQPSSRPLRELYSIRREFGILLRAALPTRDVLSSVTRDASSYFSPEVEPYMRDVFDHAAQVVELSQHHRSAASDIQELIVANLDLKMNQVMKVLTAVTVIFIPLSFVTGLYGMNFKHMPELDWSFGYPLVLGFLAIVAALIIWRMRKSGWMRFEEP